MKCIQRLCSRTKNLKSSGYCNICDDLVEDMKKKHEGIEKQNSFNKVELDLKLLIDTHSKLVQGKTIEPKIVNTLLLGGIVNILYQSEQFDNAMEKVKVLENENVANKFRLESLENWLLKLNDKFQEANEKIEDTGPKESYLKDQIDDIRKEFCTLKETIVTEASTCLPKMKSCSQCEGTFSRNVELERHMVHFHRLDKPHACEICGKTFYLEWRLKKHLSIHKGSHKTCKYFRDGKVCPFSDVGCKFVHQTENEINEDEIETIEEHETDEHETEEHETDDHICIYCNSMLPSQGDLINHMGIYHMDRFPHLQQDNSLITF